MKPVVWYLAALSGIALSASLIMRVLIGHVSVPPDPNFTPDFVGGMRFPIPVVNDAANGWPVLSLVWLLVAALGLVGWRLCRSIISTDRTIWWLILGGQAAVCLLLATMPLLLSSDPYAYVLWGRLYGVYGINPYFLRAGVVFPADPIIGQALHYYGIPPPGDDYGPLWTLLAGFVARVEQHMSLLAQVVTHRLLAICAAVGSSGGLAYILRAENVRNVARRVAAFAFHPLVLFETAVGGHNDILMIAAAIWAFAIVDAYPVLAGLLLGCAIAVKYLAGIAAPFLIIRALKRSLAGAIGSAAACGIAILLFFQPFWWGKWTMASLFAHGRDSATSISWIAIQTLWRIAGVPYLSAIRVVEAVVAVVLAMLVAYAILAYWRNPRWAQVWRAVAALIWSLPALNAWYVLWISPALASGERWARYAWWFGVAVFLHYWLDVTRRPQSAADWPSYIVALSLLTVVMLAAPVLLAHAGRETAESNSTQ